MKPDNISIALEQLEAIEEIDELLTMALEELLDDSDQGATRARLLIESYQARLSEHLDEARAPLLRQRRGMTTPPSTDQVEQEIKRALMAGIVDP